MDQHEKQIKTEREMTTMGIASYHQPDDAAIADPQYTNSLTGSRMFGLCIGPTFDAISAFVTLHGQARPAECTALLPSWMRSVPTWSPISPVGATLTPSSAQPPCSPEGSSVSLLLAVFMLGRSSHAKQKSNPAKPEMLQGQPTTPLSISLSCLARSKKDYMASSPNQ